MEVLLGAPPQVQKRTGRPTRAVHAGHGRQRLQSVGLLAGACRPPEPVCRRRSSRRPRARCLTSASPHRQPRQTALTQRHRKRPHVVSEVPGATGMASMRAMLAGARDPAQGARLRTERGHHDEATSAKALHGQWRAAPLGALAQAVARDDR